MLFLHLYLLNCGQNTSRIGNNLTFINCLFKITNLVYLYFIHLINPIYFGLAFGSLNYLKVLA